jgi:hypothetical protein
MRPTRQRDASDRTNKPRGIKEASQDLEEKNLIKQKEELLTAFRENRAAMLACARRWPDEKVEETFLGEWSLLDLLAHLAAWDDANRAGVSSVRFARLPAFYAHKDTDWETFNAGLVKLYRRRTLAEQITLVERSFAGLMDTLNHFKVEVIFKDFGVRYKDATVIIARLVESELKDEQVHLEQMRAWLNPS